MSILIGVILVLGQVKCVQNKFNHRLRKRPGYRTSYEAFYTKNEQQDQSASGVAFAMQVGGIRQI